tara:strand:+ start:232 stop:459 length:228 start_codon:yes stop_codon:yes gene_type:complete
MPNYIDQLPNDLIELIYQKKHKMDMGESFQALFQHRPQARLKSLAVVEEFELSAKEQSIMQAILNKACDSDSDSD